jgi:hypothetical protein
MRPQLKALLAVLTIAFAGPAAANGYGEGKVEIEHVGFGALVYFYTATHTDKPVCNTYRSRWAIDTSTPAGRERYAFILAAEITGKPIRVWGTGDCGSTGNSETVAAVGSMIDYSAHP